MGFYISLSGIRAASSGLNVIGNNIANISTTGFKQSRAEFADVYSSSLVGASSTVIGQGVRLSRVAQQFEQGNITFTGNSLDLAVNGDGFFKLTDENGAALYSRAGAFKVNRDGYVVNSEGMFLNARGADADGNITGSIGPIKLDNTYSAPNPTSTVNANLNLDSREPATNASWALDPVTGMPVPSGYNSATSVSVYDSLGNAHALTFYYSKNAAPPDNTWTVRAMIDGNIVTDGSGNSAFTAAFNADGTYDAAASDAINLDWSPGGGAAPNQAIAVDFTKSTQYGSEFAVNEMNQNGYTTGQVLDVDIDEQGIMFARYSNGQSRAIGQVMLVKFANQQGLQPVGDTAWAETYSSGEPVVSEPGTGGLGLVQSGALEESNVDLTEQLVLMISAQRNFQANAKAIQAEDAVTQTIINLR
jgi:flagellar hook protein FlgE